MRLRFVDSVAWDLVHYLLYKVVWDSRGINVEALEKWETGTACCRHPADCIHGWKWFCVLAVSQNWQGGCMYAYQASDPGSKGDWGHLPHRCLQWLMQSCASYARHVGVISILSVFRLTRPAEPLRYASSIKNLLGTWGKKSFAVVIHPPIE